MRKILSTPDVSIRNKRSIATCHCNECESCRHREASNRLYRRKKAVNRYEWVVWIEGLNGIELQFFHEDLSFAIDQILKIATKI